MPETLKKLIDLIAFLPGIGEKTATKLAFFLLQAPEAYCKNFSQALASLHDRTKFCTLCHGITDPEHPVCTLCTDVKREKNVLCIVEDVLDMLSIERIGVFRGRYHILGGTISPLSGRKPGDLHIQHLFDRVKDENIEELILALNPNIEGEATSLYIKEQFQNLPVRVTRLSQGLSNASFIDSADEMTLIHALKGRS